MGTTSAELFYCALPQCRSLETPPALEPYYYYYYYYEVLLLRGEWELRLGFTFPTPTPATFRSISLSRFIGLDVYRFIPTLASVRASLFLCLMSRVGDWC